MSKKLAPTRDLLLEIGTEELPASYILPALEQLFQFGQKYSSSRQIKITGTPRRLVLAISGIKTQKTQVVWGPPLERARKDDGSWAQAALGFARSRGLKADQLEIGKRKGKDYLKVESSLDLAQELAQEIPLIIKGLNFPKSMRWMTSNPFKFARPIRWILCLWGNQVLNFEAAGLKSGRTTRGHRFFGEQTISIPTADYSSFLQLLKKNKVLVDYDQRKKKLTQDLIKKTIPYQPNFGMKDLDLKLVEEVVNLVEYPRVIEGSFDREFLILPEAVLVTVMKKHQRYFPIYSSSGKLLNRFLITANGPYRSIAAIQANNERVIRARLSDGRFFWDEDRSLPLNKRVDDLGGIVFHAKLGTYLDKTNRLKKLAHIIGRKLNFSPQQLNNLDRAATLAKTDLTTNMVIEFTSLQGIMGEVYARNDGENKFVAGAIRQHYLPRSSEDELPSEKISIALALADRIDTITGFFQAGINPSGSQDPYGLRRQVLGLIRILAEKKISLSFFSLVKDALAIWGKEENSFAEITAFAATRLEVYLVGLGYPTDLVRAVLASGWDDIAATKKRVKELNKLGRSETLLAAATIVERTANIAKTEISGSTIVNPKLLEEPEEQKLFQDWKQHEKIIKNLIEQEKFTQATREYARAFSRPLGDFFQAVMVNVKDHNLKKNRISLLNNINLLYSARVADLSKLHFERGEHLV